MMQTSRFRPLIRLMMRAFTLSLLFCALGTTQHPYGQDAYSDGSIPRVTMRDNAVSLQASLYQDHYRTHSAIDDLRWVQRNDSAMIAFWNERGADILRRLSQNAGIAWVEREFDIYLVRFYQTAGEGDPLILPLGGTRVGGLTEAPAHGARLQFGLIYQLARRMLAQVDRPGGAHLSIASHPLMQPGPYRRDNLAMLLALVTAEQVIGLDSTFDAYQSAYWKHRHPGREIFEEYLLKEWILTSDQPLSTWVAREPYGSRLVIATRPPRLPRPGDGVARQRVEGLPIKGRLGFSVSVDDRNRLVVDKLDPNRLAFLSGLQEGDIIRQVDGARVSSQKQLVQRILEGLNGIGATLSILRDSQPMTVVIRPVAVSDLDEYYYEEPGDVMYDPPVAPDSASGDLSPD